MKIELIPISAVEGGNEPDFFTLRVTGPLDPKNEVLQCAREMLIETGRQEMIAAFDSSLRAGSRFAAD